MVSLAQRRRLRRVSLCHINIIRICMDSAQICPPIVSSQGNNIGLIGPSQRP